MNDYTNGILIRRKDSYYQGTLRIDGVDISPVEATFYKDGDDTRLWIKRRPLLEYDNKEHCYKQRLRRPHWEAYLRRVKGVRDAFEGTFMFLRFKYTITAHFDVTYQDKFSHVNLFVERAPIEEQTIINGIYERNKERRKDDRREYRT